MHRVPEKIKRDLQEEGLKAALKGIDPALGWGGRRRSVTLGRDVPGVDTKRGKE